MTPEFIKVCGILKQLVKETGRYKNLPSGEQAEFLLYEEYNRNDLDIFEKKYNIRLPLSYRYFLEEIGACYIYQKSPSPGITFRKISEIRGWMEEIFDGQESPFPNFLLIGLALEDEEIGFNLNKREKENFSMFFHDEEPESWIINDGYRWTTFEDWLIRVVTTEGAKTIP